MTPEGLKQRFTEFQWGEQRFADLNNFTPEASHGTAASFVLHEFARNAKHRVAIGIDREYEQAHFDLSGEYSDEEKEAFGEFAPAPRIHQEVYGNYQAITGDVINGLRRKSWSLTPTPVPSLPYKVKRAAAEAAIASMEALGEGATDAQLNSAMMGYKRQAKQYVKDRASQGVAEAETAIHDMLTETGMADEYKKAYDYAGIYPTAFMGAEIISEKKQAWNGDSLAVVEKMGFRHRAYDPRFVYPSPDATDNIRDCDNVITVEHVTEGGLIKLLQNSAFDKASVKKVLDAMTGSAGKKKLGGKWTDWCEDDYEWTPGLYQVAKMFDGLINSSSLIPVVRFSGRIPGYVIKGFKGRSKEKVEDYESTEVEIYVVADQVIRFQIDPYMGIMRPFGSASYQHVPGSIYGRSPIGLMREAARDYRSHARDLYFNSNESIYPITEVNKERLVEDDAVDEGYSAGAVIAVEGSQYEGNVSAVRRNYGDDKAASILAKMRNSKDEVEDATGIYGHLVGFASTASGNRTSKVFTSGIANSMKRYSDFVERMEMRVMNPLLKVTYQLYLAYGPINKERYEADVVVHGAMALMQKNRNIDQLGLVLQTLTQGTQYKDDQGQPLVSAPLYRAILTDWLDSNGTNVGGLLVDPREEGSMTAGQPTTAPPVAQSEATPLPVLDGRSQ